MEVVNLTASFRAHRDNVSAIFSWDLAMTLSNQQLLGYQATWTEVASPRRHSSRKLPHSLISQSQILPPVSKLTLAAQRWSLMTYHVICEEDAHKLSLRVSVQKELNSKCTPPPFPSTSRRCASYHKTLIFFFFVIINPFACKRLTVVHFSAPTDACLPVSGR